MKSTSASQAGKGCFHCHSFYKYELFTMKLYSIQFNFIYRAPKLSNCLSRHFSKPRAWTPQWIAMHMFWHIVISVSAIMLLIVASGCTHGGRQCKRTRRKAIHGKNTDAVSDGVALPRYLLRSPSLVLRLIHGPHGPLHILHPHEALVKA